MSFWARCGVSIYNLELFKRTCEQYDIDYEEVKDPNFYSQFGHQVHAVLTDRKGRGQYGSHQWFLVREGGGFKVVADQDPRYNSISNRVCRGGRNLVMRDYAKGVIVDGVAQSGGMVNSLEEKPDGTVLMRINQM